MSKVRSARGLGPHPNPSRVAVTGERFLKAKSELKPGLPMPDSVVAAFTLNRRIRRVAAKMERDV